MILVATTLTEHYLGIDDNQLRSTPMMARGAVLGFGLGIENLDFDVVSIDAAHKNMVIMHRSSSEAS